MGPAFGHRANAALLFVSCFDGEPGAYDLVEHGIAALEAL